MLARTICQWSGESRRENTLDHEYVNPDRLVHRTLVQPVCVCKFDNRTAAATQIKSQFMLSRFCEYTCVFLIKILCRLLTDALNFRRGQVMKYRIHIIVTVVHCARGYVENKLRPRRMRRIIRIHLITEMNNRISHCFRTDM
jgi:hypothetical protein